MRADDAEPLLGEHPHHRGQQPVVAGERGAADAGQNARTLGIRPQVEQRRPPHRPDQHEVLAAMFAQRGDDPAGRENPDKLMRPGRQHGGIREAFQPDQEHAAPCGTRCRGDLARQASAAREDADESATATPRGSARDGWERR